MILDIDMDYFMDKVAIHIAESSDERLLDEDYGESVWSEQRVRDFSENNLDLSANHKIKSRIVSLHNEALFFWKELIEKGELIIPFDVIHVDSHADLGLGYSSWVHILDEILKYPIEERPNHNSYTDCFNNKRKEGIGDYLLFTIAYQWISKLTYCANPNKDSNDYIFNTLKHYHEEWIWDKPVQNIIQLVHNPYMPRPENVDSIEVIKIYYRSRNLVCWIFNG